MINSYLDFFTKFNVLGLAIGLMIGSNLKDVANTFIEDVLMPFIKPILSFITGKYGRHDDDKTKSGHLHFSIPGTSIEINLEAVIIRTNRQ